jgi:hypothetical protein
MMIGMLVVARMAARAGSVDPTTIASIFARTSSSARNAIAFCRSPPNDTRLSECSHRISKFPKRGHECGSLGRWRVGEWV